MTTTAIFTDSRKNATIFSPQPTSTQNHQTEQVNHVASASFSRMDSDKPIINTQRNVVPLPPPAYMMSQPSQTTRSTRLSLTDLLERAAIQKREPDSLSPRNSGNSTTPSFTEESEESFERGELNGQTPPDSIEHSLTDLLERAEREQRSLTPPSFVSSDNSDDEEPIKSLKNTGHNNFGRPRSAYPITPLPPQIKLDERKH